MQYIHGSAVGVRWLGGVLGVGGSSLALLGAGGADNWWLCLPFVAWFGFCIVRPWAMGVWHGDHTVEVRSWFRRYKFVPDGVQSIDLVDYHGLVAISPIGWIPVIGKIRMIQVTMTDDHVIFLAATIGTYNSALRLARCIRRDLELHDP